MTLESYLTLPEAARKYGISTDALTRLVKAGIIRAVHNEEGTVLITVPTVAAAADVIHDEIRLEQYKHLRGKRIRLLEAAKKYNVDAVSLSGWVDRGYIYVHNRRPKLLEIDEADVAYVAAIYKRGRELTGSPIKTGWVIKRVLKNSEDQR